LSTGLEASPLSRCGSHRPPPRSPSGDGKATLERTSGDGPGVEQEEPEHSRPLSRRPNRSDSNESSPSRSAPAAIVLVPHLRTPLGSWLRAENGGVAAPPASAKPPKTITAAGFGNYLARGSPA